MIEEGALEDPEPDAIFALHVVPQYRAGEIAYRAGGAMASSDKLEIVVRGKQTHAAYPWLGVDPIAVASRIVLALQALPGRQMDARLPSVVSIGAIHGGVRYNIIPDEVELRGTIRTLEPSMQPDLHQRIRTTATKIAESAGASAEVNIQINYPVTYNDPQLTARMEPTLRRVAGPDRLMRGLPRTGAEDFSFLQPEGARPLLLAGGAVPRRRREGRRARLTRRSSGWTRAPWSWESAPWPTWRWTS